MMAGPHDRRNPVVYNPEYDRPTRLEAVIAMRCTGASYAQIAKTLDYASPSQARQALEYGLARTVTEEDRVEQRYLAGRAIDQLLLGVWPKATNPSHEEHLSASRTALALVDRKIRLYGLDAPAEVQVTAAGAQINEWVSLVIAESRGQLPAEVDIIEADVVEEERVGEVTG